MSNICIGSAAALEYTEKALPEKLGALPKVDAENTLAL